LVIDEITVFELAMIDSPTYAVGKGPIVFLIKRLGDILSTSAASMRKNRSAIWGLR